MAQKICETSFKPIATVEGCDPCRHYFFTRTESFQLPSGKLIMTMHYDLRTCFEGLAKGQYINAITLMPGEEINIEVVKRSKYSKSIHEQTSVESEFEHEFAISTKDTLQTTSEFNFKFGTEGEFSLLGVKAKTTTELATNIKRFNERIVQIAQSSSMRVSRRNDISIDVKTEFENSLRTLRKFKNPNNCQPVLYLISQLQKKYKTSLHLIGLSWDFIPKTEKFPSILSKPLNYALITRPGKISFNPLTFEDQRTVEKVEDDGVEKKKIDTRLVPVPMNRFKSIVQPKEERLNFEKKDFRSLNKGELEDWLEDKKFKKEVLGQVEKLETLKYLQNKEIFIKEHCIRSSDIFIETKVSPCTACTEESVRRENAEIAKIEAEVAALGN